MSSADASWAWTRISCVTRQSRVAPQRATKASGLPTGGSTLSLLPPGDTLAYPYFTLSLCTYLSCSVRARRAAPSRARCLLLGPVGWT